MAYLAIHVVFLLPVYIFLVLLEQTATDKLEHYLLYTTYYLIKVAASSFNTPLERRAPNGRPATVLHYYTVLIKDLIENTALKFKNCAQHFNGNTNNT